MASSFNSANFQYPNMFSADQLTNKFSPFQGVALPWPSQYSGWPTDALGNPIQPQPQGTTLNSSPVNANAAAASPQQPQLTPYLQQGDGRDGGGRGAQLATPPGSLAGYLDQYGDNLPIAAGQRPQGMDDQTYQAMIGPLAAKRMGLTPGAAAPQASAGASNNAMGSAYLNALANPGKVTTPGATVPQSAPPSGQSNVLQQFLANWQPQQGAGNYNNALMMNALKNQQVGWGSPMGGSTSGAS